MSAVNTNNSLNSLCISVQDLTLSDEATKKTTSEQPSTLTTSTSSKGLSSSISPSIQSLSPLSPSFSSVSAGSDISSPSLSPSPGISLSTQTGSSYFGSSSSILRSLSPSSLPPTTSLKPPSSIHTIQNQANKKIAESERLEKIEEIFQKTSIVLIAEDNPTIQRTLAFAFTKNKIPFILVGDGSEVVSAFQGRDIHVVSTNLKSTKPSDFQIKAILSDEQMPYLNGSEAIQQIRPRNPDLVAYSYTATCEADSPNADATREKLQKLGFNGVFGKKTPIKDLIAPFKKTLNIS